MSNFHTNGAIIVKGGVFIMDKDDLYLKEQRERLSKVFEYLKKQGISQREIADNTDTEEATLSSYKSGKIKYIPNAFLENLRRIYNITPRFIRRDSDYMIDIQGMKLSNFKSFVKSWDVIDRTTMDSNGKRNVQKYLHFTMDKNFYDFLIEVDKAHQAVNEGLSDLTGEIEQLKEIFSGEPDLQEFVLVPRNNFINAVTDLIQPRKTFEELIDTSEYESYIKE